MADDGTTVKITINGAHLANIENHAFAVLLDEPEPVRWKITTNGDGTIQFTDINTGGDLSVDADEPGAQVQVSPTPTAAPGWIVRQVTAEDADGEPLAEIRESGLYSLEAAGTGQFLGRRVIEDRSLLPKPVVLQEPGAPRSHIVIEVAGR